MKPTENSKTSPPPPVEIPISALASETLLQIVEAFVLREGTDYGEVEVPLAIKVEQVLAQIKKGDVKLYFDSETESVTLVPVRPA